MIINPIGMFLDIQSKYPIKFDIFYLNDISLSIRLKNSNNFILNILKILF